MIRNIQSCWMILMWFMMVFTSFVLRFCGFLSHLYLSSQVSQGIFPSVSVLWFCMCLCYCATTGTWPDAGWEITFETSTILRTALVPWEPATNSRGWEIMEMRWRKKTCPEKTIEDILRIASDPCCELQGLYFEGLSRSPGLLAEGKRAKESCVPQDAWSKNLVLKWVEHDFPALA